MKKITTLRELQMAELFILKEFLVVCYNLNIKPYLLGGTLIGAVRHKGFIPWDDDIDICMSRPDYNLLLKETKGKIGEKCSIIDPKTDKDFKGIVPLVVYENSSVSSLQFRNNEKLKLSISVFIYDGAPKGIFNQRRYYNQMYVLRAKHALCRANFRHVNTKIAKLIGPILQPFFRYDRLFVYKNKILTRQEKYSFENSNLVCTNVDNNSILEVFPKVDFLNNEKVYFEGIECYTFSYYKEHLTKYYGDYMRLPPENERIQKHSFDVDIEDSFDFDWNK